MKKFGSLLSIMALFMLVFSGLAFAAPTTPHNEGLAKHAIKAKCENSTHKHAIKAKHTKKACKDPAHKHGDKAKHKKAGKHAKAKIDKHAGHKHAKAKHGDKK